MAIRRYLIDLETKSIDLTQNEIKNAVVHNLDSGSRPASPLEGQLMFNTDSKLLELWNGSAWLPIPNQLTGQLTFADYGLGTYTSTVSTIAGFDSSGNLIELNGSNFIIPGLTTGIEEGIIGYDANNKLIKSLLIKIYGQDLSYGFGYGAADNNIGLDVMAVGTDAANYNIGNLVNAFGPSAAFNNQGSIVNAFGMGAGYGNIFNNVHIFSHYGGVADNHNQVVLGDATITKTKLYGTVVNPSYGTGTNTGTVSTLAAFDLSGKLIEIDGSNFVLPNLGTGTEVGIVAYDANDKLLKSQLITIDGTNVDVKGNLIINEFSIIGNTPNATLKLNTSVGSELRYATNSILAKNNSLDFKTNELVRITVIQDGRVGIGTASPQTQLHLKGGTARFSGVSSNWLDIDANYNNANNVGITSRFNGIFINANSGAAAPFIELQTDNSTRLGIDSGGKVTFNEYGTGTITGTESTFPVFTASGDIVESQLITTDGTNIGIGTSTPSSKLDVAGAISLDGKISLRRNISAQSWYVGELAGANSNSYRSNAFGFRASINNTADAYSDSFGSYALENNTAGYSNGFGGFALQNNTGPYSNGFGFQALQNNTAANSNGFGASSLRNNSGTNSNGFGRLTLFNNSGIGNTAFGNEAGYETSILTGSDNTFLGSNASYGTATNISNATAVGANVTLTNSNTVILGNNANVGIGTTNPTEKLTILGGNSILFTGVSPQNRPVSIGTTTSDDLRIEAAIGSGKTIRLGDAGRNITVAGGAFTYKSDVHIFRNVANASLFELGISGNAKLTSYGTGSITGTEATFPAFQADGKIVESQLITTDGSNIALTNLTTGVDAGVVAYDADNKLLKSQLITISAGNLGIGITNPERKLHVVGTTRPAMFGSDNAVNIVKFYNSATGKNSLQGFDIVVNSTASAQLSSYNLPLIFAVSNALNTAASPALTINKDKSIKYDAYGTGTITGTESTFAAFDNSGKLLESNILKIGAAPDGGGAIGINTDPDWPLHIKGGVFNMALIESTSNTARLLFKTSTSTIFPLIEVIGDNMLLDAPKVTVKNTHLDSPTSGGDSRILGIDINNKIILSDGIRTTPNLSGLPTLDLRNVDTYVTNTLAGFDGTKIVNNPHIEILEAGSFTNVGIGGTPQFPLHVFGDTRNNAMFVEGQNNETRLAVRDLSGGNIYMASRFGVMKLFSNSNIQLWAGGTNKATINANGTVTLNTYGLGNNIGSEATFPVFDSSGVIRESRFITINGSTVSITDLDLTSDNVNALLAKTPSYVDNASALAGGLTVGDTYYNNLLNTYTRVT